MSSSRPVSGGSRPAAVRSVVGQTWVLISIAVLGVAASLLVAHALRERERRLFDAEFDHRAQDRALAIERELRSSLEHVVSVAAFYAASEAVSPEQFRSFASTTLHAHPSLQALGFNAVVPHRLREAHQAAMRHQGFDGYRITERAPDGRLVPAARRDSYVTVTLIEPLEGNEAALGYDIASEPVRREALDRARDTGEPAVTGRLKLVQEPAEQFGVLITVPLFAAEHLPTVAERRSWLRGYAVGVLRIGDVVDYALSTLRPSGVHLTVTDDSAPQDMALLHFHRSRAATGWEREFRRESLESSEIQRSYGFEIAGRRWTVHAVPTAGLLASRVGWAPMIVFVSGLLITACVVWYLWWQASINERLRGAITDLARAEDRQAGFGRMVDESHDEFYVFDAETLKFLHVNRGARVNLGYSMAELREMTPLDLKPEMTPESFAQRLLPLRTGERNKVEFTTVHRRKDGSLYDVDVHLQLSAFDGKRAFFAVLLDVTERKRLEEKFHQSQRIEALGTLTGGIAHDFNNLLTAIVGYTELGLASLPSGDAARKRLEEVIKASERARNLVRQILTFSRDSQIERKPIDLRDLVREALQLARASLPATIEIHEELAPACRIVGDATRIHQVLMNLCANAGHAMREISGVLDVRLDSVELDAATAARVGNLEPGRYARISVHDNGHGIAPEILDRIFDPFFTTKQPGEGTGMGLSVAHGIVKAHAGALTVTSRPDQGTKFEIFLPQAEVSAAVATEPPETAARGGESILVVEDEPTILELFRETLEQAGFKVTGFCDSVEALEAFRANPQAYDLIVTDYTMPKMTGTRLALEARRTAPQIPVILVSGFGNLVDERELRESGIRVMLAKPLRIHELSRAVRRSLDQTSSLGTPQHDLDRDRPLRGA